MKSMWTMRPEPPRLAPSAGQSGFAIVSAIFLLVVLAALGAFMISLSGNQQLGLAQDVSGSRALQAARAGLEWGVCMAVKDPAGANYCGTGTVAAPAAPCSASVTHAAGAFANLADFTVVVSCSKTCIDEGTACPSGSSSAYLITSTACNSSTCPNTASPGSQYGERQLRALVEN